MKTQILSLIVGLITIASAQADGFVCSSATGLKVKVYNHTYASEGTRNAAVMILSDSNVGAGRKTIATFESENELVHNKGSIYQAKVDLRFSESNRAGELIAGTKLGYIDTILLAVAFTYGDDYANGDALKANLIVSKRDGSKVRMKMACVRYLKN